MSNRSPGPWTLTETRIFSGDRMVAEADRLADARLIAAAPELLAAAIRAARFLWEVASEVEDGVRTLNENSPEGEAWAALTDAIAKAEGTA